MKLKIGIAMTLTLAAIWRELGTNDFLAWLVIVLLAALAIVALILLAHYVAMKHGE